MKIKGLHIRRFGGVKEKRLHFEEGFNELSFENEFGKTSCIEAIKTALYGFSPLKDYPYLPLSAEQLDFDCEIDCSAESLAIGRIKLQRVHSGERSSGTLSFLDRSKERAVRNKSLFSALEEAGLPAIEELAPEFWMIDSESIEQERRFMQRTEASSLSLLDGIGYRGKSEAELLEELSAAQKKIYTNHANSVSMIKKNEAELSKIRGLIRELSRAEEASVREYRESLILVDKIAELEEEKERLKEKKLLLEREREAEELRSALRSSLRVYEERGYEKLEKTPNLGMLRALIEELRLAGAERKRLEDSLSAELERDFDPVVKELIGLKREEKISRLFALYLDLQKTSARLGELRSGIEKMTMEAETLSVESCRNEFQNYQLLYAKWKSGTEGAGSFGKKSFLFALTLLLLSAIGFVFDKMIGFALLFSLGIFLAFQYGRMGRETEKRETSMSAFSVDAFSELGKLKHASALIHKLREPSEELSELIYAELEEISSYQSLRAERDALWDAFEEILAEEPELSRIFLAEGRDPEVLFHRYRREEFACRRSEEEIAMLQEKLREAKEKETRLAGKLGRARSLLIELWNTSDPEKIEEIRIEAEAHRKRRLDLEAIAEEKKISLDNLLDEGYNFHKELEELESDLEEIERRLVEKKERSARLEERLSSSPMLSSPDYRGLSIEDLEDLSLQIRAKNESLHYEYDVLEWKIRIIKRSFEILKRRLKPSFVERAGAYFSSIAEDAKLSIDYGLEGSIVFQDKESAEYLDYSRLSTGSQAQVLLALKLSYLEEIDPNHNYPLILDDALMSYDKKRKKTAVDLLRKIAEERQILYFKAE